MNGPIREATKDELMDVIEDLRIQRLELELAIAKQKRDFTRVIKCLNAQIDELVAKSKKEKKGE